MPRSGGGAYSLPAGSTIANGDTSDADDLNAPLADIAADLNTPRPVVAGGTGAASAADARTNLGLAIGTNVQAYDADLAAIAGLTSAADRLPYYTGAGTAALATFTAAGRALVDDADATAQRATLGLVIGTNVQAYDAALASLAGLSLAQGDILYATAADTLARLPKGTAAQVLAINAGATAPEWVTLSSSAPSTSEVLAATAGAALGDVGSYALMTFSSNTTAIEGTTHAGSAIRYSNAAGTSAGSAIPSGTWRLMGRTSNSSADSSTSLFLRIV